MNAEKQLSAKKAWAQLNERARLGDRFAKIAMLGLLLKSGHLTRAQVLEQLIAAGVTQEDLRKFRTQRGLAPGKS